VGRGVFGEKHMGELRKSEHHVFFVGKLMLKHKLSTILKHDGVEVDDLPN